MSPNMLMETSTNGGLGKALGRMFSGERMFQNIYTAQGGPGMIVFASSFPGSVKAFEIAPGQEMIFQKSAFLAGEAGVELSISFSKRFSSGLFGGGRIYLYRKPAAAGLCLQNLMVTWWNMCFSRGSRL